MTIQEKRRNIKMATIWGIIACIFVNFFIYFIFFFFNQEVIEKGYLISGIFEKTIFNAAPYMLTGTIVFIISWGIRGSVHNSSYGIDLENATISELEQQEILIKKTIDRKRNPDQLQIPYKPYPGGEK